MSIHGPGLRRAARQGDLDRVLELLDGAACGVDARGGADRRTSLHLAARAGHVDVVEVLLAAGADANAQDAEGWTALHVAAGAGHRAVVAALLAAGADASMRDNGGYLPLHVALNGHEPELTVLLREATLPRR